MSISRLAALFLAASAALAGTTRAADIIVSTGGSIQAGIAAAVAGDRVLVHLGTYNETISFLGKAIKVQALGGAVLTTIDGGGGTTPVVSCTSGEPAGAELIGFRIRNARSGILMVAGSHLRVQGCVIENAVAVGPADLGAGVGVDSRFSAIGNLALVECIVRSNAGFGILGQVAAQRCTILGNGRSGVRGEPVQLFDCRILFNDSPDDGGGVHFGSFPGQVSAIQRCFIANNQAAGNGGGIYGTNLDSSASVEVESCEIVNNHAAGSGGGVYLRAFNLGFGLVLADLSRCVIANNSSNNVGGGAFLDSTGFARLLGCTVFGNQPDGVTTAAGFRSATDSIFWNQPQPFTAAGFVSGCDVQGGWTGPGSLNFDLDPLFVDPANGDLHLRAESPCRDVATLAADPDFQGDSTLGALADVGADEFRAHFSLTGATTPGGIAQLNVYGTPAATPVLLFASLSRLASPLNTPYGPFQLGFPLVAGFPVALGTIPAGSRLAIPLVIPALAPLGGAIHIQGFVGGADSLLTNAETLVIG